MHNGKKLYQTDSVIYLGIHLDKCQSSKYSVTINAMYWNFSFYEQNN